MGRGSPAGGSQGTARTPSKRSKPNSVPSQRYPSGVCAIAWIWPLVKPSRTFHAVCAYWLTSSDGSNAKAQGHAASNTPASRRPRARARPRLCPRSAATRRARLRVVSVLITPTSYRNLFRRMSSFSLPEDWSGFVPSLRDSPLFFYLLPPALPCRATVCFVPSGLRSAAHSNISSLFRLSSMSSSLVFPLGLGKLQWHVSEINQRRSESRRDGTICSPARQCRVKNQEKKTSPGGTAQMPNSYVSNHVHVVFSTKNRYKTIDESLQPKLWAYLAGVAKNHGMYAVAVGGIDDHVHALINL